MDRLDRLYKKVLEGMNSIEERKRIEATIEELEQYFNTCDDTPLTEEEKRAMDALIAEFEEKYG